MEKKENVVSSNGGGSGFNTYQHTPFYSTKREEEENTSYLALGYSIIDVDGGEEEGVILEHLVQTVHTSGGLLGDTLDVLDQSGPHLWVNLLAFLEQTVDNGQLLVVLIVVENGGVLLGLEAPVNHEGGITSVIDNQLGSELSSVPQQGVHGALPVLLEGLSLPGEDGHTGDGDGGSGMILCGEDVARAPPDVSAEVCQGLDQDSGLHGHVQRSHHADALERLVVVLFTACHQTGHLLLGDVDLLPSEFGQADVFDLWTTFVDECECGVCVV